MTILKSIKNRRTFYHITSQSSISDAKLIKLVEEALLHTPSAFNMQSARIVLLLKKNHNLFWDIVKNTLKQIIPEDKFESTELRINSFANGYGTVLFYNNTDTIDQFSNKFQLYKDNLPVWAEQENGMLQSNIWMLLEEAGLGASLQHYNPIIDEKVRETWNIPNSWRLIAQMPFGVPNKQPEKKEFAPIENRIKIFK
jgi:predicted oxidoreductase (fatty acid repression mutant protein)